MITAVCLPKLKRLGMGAFYEAGVETVTGMEMLEEGGGNAFSETPFWENYNETSGEELFICNHILLFGRGCGKRLEIPEGVTQIAPGAFSQEHGINVVVIPESIEEIGAYAFDESYVPETVYMPAKDVRLGSHVFGRKERLHTIRLVSDGVLQEGNGDFLVAGTTLLDYRGEDVDVIIPDNVKIIGEEAFGANADIVSVSIPEGVTEIGENAFSGCESLQKVSMPSTLTTIRYGAFEFCPALENIDLQYVQEIGEDAFCVCTQLHDIELSSIKSIGTEAFANSGVMHVGGMEGLTDFGDRILPARRCLGKIRCALQGASCLTGKAVQAISQSPTA